MDVLRRSRKIKPRRLIQFFSVEIIYGHVQQDQLPQLVRLREAVDPAGVNILIGEVPYVDVFDGCIAGVEGVVSDVLITVFSCRANPLQ